jgi:hypothetical protein
MPLPNLIHPIPVQLEIYDAAGQVIDDDTREPVHGARNASGTTVTLEAQVDYPRDQAVLVEAGGVRLQSSGYILVRRQDLRDLGVAPKRGDRIVQIGEGVNALTVNLFITGYEPMAIYPDQGGPTLMKYNFEDRDPISSSAAPESTA